VEALTWVMLWGMLDALRKRGLVLFLLALAVVSLVQGLTRGRAASVALAAVMLATAIEEAQRREILPRLVWVDALRWSCVIGAVGFLLSA